MFKQIGLIGMLCVLAFTGCDSGAPVGPRGKQPPDLSITPMESEEAEIAAMVISRELVAPKWLYDRIRADLAHIREKFLDSIPAVAITFQSRWRPSSLGMQLDAQVFFDTVSGGGRMFDSLNQIYRLDTIYRQFDDFYVLRFKGRLNSVRLVDIYASIPGEYQNWPYSGQVGDHSMLLIWPDGKTFKYFFRDAWGDCPAGCTESEVYYLSSREGSITHIGDYRLGTDPIPTWFDTVTLAWGTIDYWKDWHADSNQAGL